MRNFFDLLWLALVMYLIFLIVPARAAEIQNERARQIQVALQRSGVHVQITGRMDAQTKAALKSMAKENKWQTKIVPDARVLGLLGLGAKHDDLGNNPEALWKRTTRIEAARR